MRKNNKLIIIFVVLAAVAVFVIAGLGYAFEPLLLSFVIAYLVFPAIKKLEKTGVNRVVAVSVILAVMTAMMVFFIIAFVPWILGEAGSFLKELPENMAKAIKMAELFASKAGLNLDLSGKGFDRLISDQAALLSSDILGQATGAVKGIFTNVFKWLLALLNILIIPLFFFFIVNDYEKIRNEVKSYIPAKFMPVAHNYMARINRILSGYIRGKLVVALVLGLMYGAGLHIIGLKYGFMIGFATGVLSIIPYLGSIIGFFAAVIVGLAYYQGIWLLVGIGIVFTVAQLLESYIITPKLVGDSVGISAFATILSIIIGGNLMGVTGILIAIPVAAILKEVLIDLKHQYHFLMKSGVNKKR